MHEYACALLTLSKKTAATIISFFFFNDTATTEIYTLSLHDALPIYLSPHAREVLRVDQLLERLVAAVVGADGESEDRLDRKSTRLNSSTVKSRMPSSA